MKIKLCIGVMMSVAKPRDGKRGKQQAEWNSDEAYVSNVCSDQDEESEKPRIKKRSGLEGKVEWWNVFLFYFIIISIGES